MTHFYEPDNDNLSFPGLTRESTKKPERKTVPAKIVLFPTQKN